MLLIAIEWVAYYATFAVLWLLAIHLLGAVWAAFTGQGRRNQAKRSVAAFSRRVGGLPILLPIYAIALARASVRELVRRWLVKHGGFLRG